jgi:hypothetical protein
MVTYFHHGSDIGLCGKSQLGVLEPCSSLHLRESSSLAQRLLSSGRAWLAPKKAQAWLAHSKGKPLFAILQEKPPCYATIDRIDSVILKLGKSKAKNRSGNGWQVRPSRKKRQTAAFSRPASTQTAEAEMLARVQDGNLPRGCHYFHCGDLGASEIIRLSSGCQGILFAGLGQFLQVSNLAEALTSGCPCPRKQPLPQRRIYAGLLS